jgi:hypothetical protein
MKIRVWGLAAGCRTTADAARGAFTWREYNTESFPVKDWLEVLTVEKLGEGKETA